MIRFFFRIVRERGLRFFYDYFVEALWFDFMHFTDTAMRVSKKDQESTVNSNHFNDGLLYVASFTSVVNDTVELTITFCEKNLIPLGKFIDLGCGKGKTLILVDKYFRNFFPDGIVGIEYDSDLVSIGQSNLKKSKLSKEVSLIHDSAINVSNYISRSVPLIYLYNSFQGDTLYKVLKQLSGCEHLLIYVDPVEANELIQRNYVELNSNVGRYNADTWKLFHFKPNAK